MDLRLERVGAIAIGASRKHLPVDGREKFLTGPMRAGAMHTRNPAVAGKGGNRLERLFQRVLRGSIAFEKILHPLREPAHAALGTSLRSSNPTAEFGHLASGKNRGKTRVSGIEKVVTFVKHVARPPLRRLICSLLEGDRFGCGLRDHERMVGYDDGGRARAANRLLDEADPVVGAG